MKTSDAAQRMLALEDHGHDFTVEQYLTWLLELDDAPHDAGKVLAREVSRGMLLAEGHYTRVSSGVAVMNPRAILTIGFTQGATFAAAALGHQPG